MSTFDFGKKILSSDFGTPGIYRAKILKPADNGIRVYIPSLTNSSYIPIEENGTIKADYTTHERAFPIATTLDYESTNLSGLEGTSCWVVFEGGNFNNPVILGYFGGASSESLSSVNGTGTYNGVDVTTDNTNRDAIFNFLHKAGASIAGACGMLANIRYESEFNPTLVEASGGGGYGICQWTGSRNTGLKRWCAANSYDYTSMTGQLNFLLYELQSSYLATWNQMKSATNTEDGAKEASKYITWHFEIPANTAWTANYRAPTAAEYFKIYSTAISSAETASTSGTISSNISEDIKAKILSYISENGTGTASAKKHGNAAGTQCVQLCKHYIEKVWGISTYNAALGNGNEMYWKVPQTYSNLFTRINYTSGMAFQTGDIISLSGSGQYGHAALIKSASGNNITILEQWAGSNTVRIATFTPGSDSTRKVLGVARPI